MHAITCIVKLILSFGLVVALVVGYALSFHVFTLGPWSLGMYGIILLADFFVQFTCSLLNRFSVNRIASQAVGDTEKALNRSEQRRVDISMTVVGFREDEDVWRKCLRSLQRQTLRPRSLIAVVDGNEPTDLVMAEVFAAEFHGQNSKVIDVPVILSKVYKEAYYEALVASGEVTPGRMTAVRRWFKNTTTPGELRAHKIARDRIIAEISTWEKAYGLSNYSAVCITQPHGHKRVSSLLFCYMSITSLTFTDRDVHSIRSCNVWLPYERCSFYHGLGHYPW